MDSRSQKRNFKKGISVEDNRRRREENSVKLRKEKKEEGLAKKRNLQINNFVKDNTDVSTADKESAESATGNSKIPSVSAIPQLLMGLHSEDRACQINSLRGFRRLLSIEKNPPVDECISCGAVAMFVTLLQRFDCVELQFEAAWALTNIASTDRTRVVAESNAVGPLVALLTSENADVREQCAWCLGNIAGDGADLRELVLGQGALAPLLANIAQPTSISLLRNCTWSLSNLCRGKPQPNLSQIGGALPMLAKILELSDDVETIVDATWALSYVSDGDDTRIQAVVDLGVVPHLVKMLTGDKLSLLVPALRTLGNIVSGNEHQTQAVVNANVLSALAPLLTVGKKNIRKEACWMLSNIAAGTEQQMTELFQVPNLLTNVIGQLSPSTEWDVRREAMWVISNVLTAGQKPHIRALVEMGVIKPLCEILDVAEVKILLIALEALEAVLKVGAASNLEFTRLVDEAGGVDNLEKLQEHENQKIYDRAVHLIEHYFGCDDEGETENLAPAATNSSFSFGFPQTTGKAAVDFGSQNGFQNSHQFSF